jgi:uncharacterized membrane protein
MLGSIGLDSLGFHIPALRQIAGFLFLALVPGVLILRIMKVHNISIIESLLYTVGLSIALSMFTGVALNFALPPLGITRPMSTLPLAAALTTFSIILGVIAYIRDKDFSPARVPTERPSFRFSLNQVLLSVLLPLLAILGASLVNSHQSNAVLLALILLIATIIGLAAFNKFLTPQIFPLMVVMIGISLLYQTTLISDYLVGSDIHEEYYLAKLVAETGYWDASIFSVINSCLSIVVLSPVYSLILNTDIVWLLKVVYPLLFALLPLALFRVFRLQMGPRYAFLAALFFVSTPMFFMDMAQLARQQVSELFFVLVILLMVERRLTVTQRTALVIVFSIGVITSHYGLGTGYVIGYLTTGSLVIVTIKSRFGRALWQWLVGKSNSLPTDLTSTGAFTKKALIIIVATGLLFMFCYYSGVASSAALTGPTVASSISQSVASSISQSVASSISQSVASNISQSTAQHVTTGSFTYLNPQTKEPLTQTALGLDFAIASPTGKVWRVLQYMVELCLVVGLVRFVFRPRALSFDFKAEYISLTLVSVLILLGIFILPTQGWGMGVTRIFQITLLLTTPLFFLGGDLIVSGITRAATLFRRTLVTGLRPTSPAPLRFVVLAIMVPYFIFNSGAVFEIFRSQTSYFIDTPYSVALSSHRIDLSTVFVRQDIAAAKWLSMEGKKDLPTYVDHHSNKLFINKVDFPQQVTELQSLVTEAFLPGSDAVRDMLRDAKTTDPIYYIYLRTWNTQTGTLTFGSGYATRQSIAFADFPWFAEGIKAGDRIYNNGSAQVLMPTQNQL